MYTYNGASEVNNVSIFVIVFRLHCLGLAHVSSCYLNRWKTIAYSLIAIYQRLTIYSPNNLQFTYRARRIFQMYAPV